ncbi:uncharacterized protein LOC143191677 isoform X2 [Rhynchophorus ferrugineus]|uniref:uncharacterized protein LOC143191677 isoform X2 n=1 Tax=Rhynchophorus ferrugineus TaxID=354439 RepID=UPI003FCCA428
MYYSVTIEKIAQYICNYCFEKISKWLEFKTMCLKSNIVFEEKLKLRMGISENVEYQSSSSQLDKPNIIQTTKIRSISETKLDVTDNLHTSDTTFNCQFCQKAFEYYIDCLDHQNEHDGEAIFNCESCKISFCSKIDLARHEKSHKLPCKICGVQIQKQSMKLHLNKHTDKFRCSHCAATFTCGPLLNEHLTARHLKIKIHCCDFCGKNFATKRSLMLHLKTHSDKREYQCTKCNYAGRTSISLRIHMSKHENNICICEYCSKTFKSNRNLNDHLRRVHCSQKKHICNFCGMKFALRYLLEIHQRTHSGIHPYECKKCPKTFARSDGLREHMRTHDRTELFICTVCSRQFLTKRGLRRHNMAHSTDG